MFYVDKENFEEYQSIWSSRNPYMDDYTITIKELKELIEGLPDDYYFSVSAEEFITEVIIFRKTGNEVVHDKRYKNKTYDLEMEVVKEIC